MKPTAPLAPSLLITLLSFSAAAAPLGPDAWSATLIVESPGRPAIRQKLYQSGNRQRAETALPNGMQTVRIVRLDQKKVYMVMPGGRCLAMPIPPEAAAMVLGGKPPPGTTVTDLGTETKDGHRCRVQRIVSTGPHGTVTAKAWRAIDLHGAPIRFETTLPDGTTMVSRFEEVKVGPQPASLFQPPSGCRAMGGFGPMQMGHRAP